MMKFLIAALVAMLAVSTADAQTIIGATGGGTFVLKDDQTVGVGEVFTEIGVAFPITGRQSGELVGLVGKQTGDSDAGGVLWRHFFDAVPDNPVEVGYTAGIFAMGTNTTAELGETTIFAGGGINARVSGSDGDRVVAFAEFFGSVNGDDAAILRFGLSAAVN